MPKVLTENLQPGMVLETDIKDLSGRMLLKAGIEFQEKHFRVLHTWGVLSVDIIDENDTQETDPLNDLPSEIISQIEREIAKRFSGVDTSHPVMMKLTEIVTADLIKQHLTEESHA